VRGLKKVTLRYFLAFFHSFFLAIPPGSTIADGVRMHDACPLPDLTGTLSRYCRHTTFRRGYLRDAKKAVIAAAFRGGAVVTIAATATATVAQLTDPRRIHLGPFGEPCGPRWALGTRARASALVLNALLSFLLLRLARNNMHATPSNAHLPIVRITTDDSLNEKRQFVVSSITWIGFQDIKGN